MSETREGWLEKKREFLKKLQESVEYDEFRLEPKMALPKFSFLSVIV